MQRDKNGNANNVVFYAILAHPSLHGNPTGMRESTSVFQIRTINWSKFDK